MEEWTGTLDQELKITSHDYIRVTCGNCGKIVFAIEDTSPEKKGTINIKTETGVTIVFVCEICKGQAKANVIHLSKPEPEIPTCGTCEHGPIWHERWKKDLDPTFIAACTWKGCPCKEFVQKVIKNG